MAADPEYGRRRFLKDSVFSLLRRRPNRRPEATGYGRRERSLSPSFWSGAHVVEIVSKPARLAVLWLSGGMAPL